jgi:hypothetical protein
VRSLNPLKPQIAVGLIAAWFGSIVVAQPPGENPWAASVLSRTNFHKRL